MLGDVITRWLADNPRARVTDKMPFNFLWAGLIHLAFPRATILHCRRAAVDTALSIHQTHFHPSLAFPTRGVELVAYFRCYQCLTDHWRRVLPADRFLEIDYEELTREPEPVIRLIIAACGLLATVLACSDKSSSPAAPTPVANGTGSNAPATAANASNTTIFPAALRVPDGGRRSGRRSFLGRRVSARPRSSTSSPRRAARRCRVCP
jgi:hypothetical protein